MNKKIVIGLSLSLLSSTAFSDTYAKVDVGVSRIQADSFKFHNPVGTGFTTNATSGDHVILENVSEDDDASALSIVIGQGFDDSGLRTELNYTFRNDVTFTGTATFGGNDFNQDLNVDSDSLMLFGYYDFKSSDTSTFYAGLGIGAAFNSAKGFQGANLGGNGYFPENDRTEFAWGAALGFSTNISEKSTFTIEYNYIDLGFANTGTTDASFAAVGMNADERLESELFTQDFKLGLRFSF